MKKIILILCLLSVKSIAQEAILPIELLAGTKRVFFQATVIKPLTKNWNYLAFNIARADYENKSSFNEALLIHLVSRQVTKRFALTGGLQLHNVRGFVPSLGFFYRYDSPNFTFYTLPLYTFFQKTTAEAVSAIEFKPKLATNLKLYTRIQNLYNYSFENKQHNRSYLQYRLGLTHKKMTYGIGADYDYYGKDKTEYINGGAFAIINL